MSNDVITTTTFERLAFDNISHLPRGTEPCAATIADPTTLSPGDLVWAHSRGNWRVVVVESVGRKNAKGVYTTAGAVDQALRSAEDAEKALSPSATAAREAQVSDQARRNWATLEAKIDGTYDLFARFPDQYPAERRAAVAAEAQAKVEAYGSVEAYVAAEVSRHDAEIERWAEKCRRPLVERVGFTSVTLKPEQVKVAS